MTGFNGTPHNTAKYGEIAKTVVMPGDPLRARFIAENFLEEAKEFNHVRGMLGYTGTYKGKRISVMGHGMGIPSMAIYSYELYKFYDVDNIIRVGSCGGYLKEMDLFDIVLAEAAYSPSSFADVAYGYSVYGIEHGEVLVQQLRLILRKVANLDTITHLEFALVGYLPHDALDEGGFTFTIATHQSHLLATL